MCGCMHAVRVGLGGESNRLAGERRVWFEGVRGELGIVEIGGYTTITSSNNKKKEKEDSGSKDSDK